MTDPQELRVFKEGEDIVKLNSLTWIVKKPVVGDPDRWVQVSSTVAYHLLHGNQLKWPALKDREYYGKYYNNKFPSV